MADLFTSDSGYSTGVNKADYAADAKGTGGGMSPGMMAGLGLGSYVAGTALDALGQMQGAGAMQRQAESQAREQDGYSQQRYNALIGTLAKSSPLAGQSLGAVALQRRMQAMQPAIAAGGKALGVGAAGQTQVENALMPGQRIAALGEGQGLAGIHQQQDLFKLGGTMQDIGARAGFQQSLYPEQTALAGAKGEQWRMLGSGLQSGLPLVGLAMGKRATPEQVAQRQQGTTA